MSIIYHGATPGGGGGAGSRVLVPHDETISPGATWHWPLNDEVETVTGGSPVDLTGTLVYHPSGVGDLPLGSLDAKRCNGVDTGAIGAAVRIQTAITVAAWVRASATQTVNLGICGARVTGAGEANNIQWELGVDSSTDTIRSIWQNGDADNTNVLDATVALVTDTWEHWCLTRNEAGTITKLYKNGALDATSGTLIKATGGTNCSNIIIGQNTAGTKFQGDIFSAIVYEAELSDSGVLALYNSTSSTGTWA